jgi:hypothetical protein
LPGSSTNPVWVIIMPGMVSMPNSIPSWPITAWSWTSGVPVSVAVFCT